MAPRQKPKQVVFTPVGDVDDEISDAEFVDQRSQEELDFEKFRDEMRDSIEYAKYTVARVPTDSKGRQIGKQLMQMFESGIEDYTFSQLCARIRDDYGTGIYKITARQANGQFGFQQIIGIEAPKADGPDNPQASNAGELLDTFSMAIERQQARMEGMFKDLAGPQSGGDAFDQMTKMMTAMGAMMGAIGLNPQPPKSMVDQLTEWKMLKELFEHDGGGAGGEANMYSLLTETVKNFGPLLGAAIAAQTQSGAIPLSGPVRALPNPATAAPAESTLTGELEAMRPQINFLVGQAKLGAKPDDVAAAIIPGIPEAALESIEGFLQKPDCIEVCASVNAEVNAFRPWLEQWREAMLKRLAEMFEDVAAGDEIIGPTEMAESSETPVLTDTPTGEQDSGAVVGQATDNAISAADEQTADSGDPDGDTVGGSGD
jgi:hypothetical protein